jgi:FMN phosphatase YigB (HAD superfamily)
MIRGVTFDCWGTLITDRGFERSMAGRVDAVAEACDMSRQDAAELLDRALRQHHDEWLNERQYGSTGMAKFCMTELGITDDEACARLGEALEEAGRLGSQSALPGAQQTLRMLREAGLRTALVCDAGFTPGRIVRDFLSEHGLLEHLEHCSFSNEVGVPKPDPRMFRDALDAIDVRPAEAVHVGDLLRTDIWGARSVGMRTIRITAINDDATERVSWDPGAPLGRSAARSASTRAVEPPRSDDADAIVASHSEIPAALRALGAAI